MATQITQGVKVSVSTQYQPHYSAPAQGHFVFTYKIRIENHSDSTIRLLTRKWNIFDSIGKHTSAGGVGVVGQQPVLEPGEFHEYVSGCNLKSSIGKMHGKYRFEILLSGQSFDVKIPEFNLIMPSLLN